MISKKMRNISMVCLSLVLALSLAFGLSSFSSIKKASAAQTDDYSISFTGKKVVYTLGGVDQQVSTTSSDGGTDITSNFKTAETFGDGAFSITASSSNMVLENNGLKWQKMDCSITFVLERTADVIFSFRTGSSGRGVTFSSTDVADFASETHKKENNSGVMSVTKEGLKAGTYVITNAQDSTINLQTVSVSYNEPAIKTFTVSFNANGGKGTMSNQTFTENVAANLTSNTFERTGYNFLGWSTDKDATEATYTDAQSVTIAADTELFAVWELDASFVKPSITEYDAVSNVEIDFGTAIDAIELPAEVTSGKYSFPVTWTWDKEYDATVLQNYTLTGNVEVDADVYDVTAAAPTMQVIVKEIAVASTSLNITATQDGIYDALPAIVTIDEVQFEVVWGEYADGVVIGTLKAKTGYDVSNATVTANISLLTPAVSYDFNNYTTAADAQEAGYTLGTNSSNNWGVEAQTIDNVSYSMIKGKDGAYIEFFAEANTKIVVTIYSGREVASSFYNNNSTTALSTVTTTAGAFKDFEYVTTENGVYRFEVDGSQSSTYIKEIQISDFGYTYIGKVGGVDAFAKAEYLGISFRKSAESPAVRFGYVVTIVDANENALNGLTLNASAVFNIDNLTNSKSTDVPFESLKIAYNENKGGYLANLSITGIDSAKAQNALNVDMTITINGVSIIAESDAIESDTIVSKAQKLYDAGQLTDAQAEIYGVVLNG